MSAGVRTFVRVLATHWRPLLTWFLLGETVHLTFMHLAAYAGAYSSLGGLLVLPIAVLGRLVAFVAMFLTVRPSLPNVVAADTIGDAMTARARWTAFSQSVLAAILPFLAFYTAWGLLDADRIQFSRLARDWLLRNEGLSDDFSTDDRLGGFVFGPLPVVVLIVALTIRLLTARHAARLPVWTAPVTVYAEAVWVFLLVTFVSQQLVVVRRWLEGRVALQWANDVGDWFADRVPPVAFVWEWGVAAIGLLGPAVLLPLAWITVAGLIYGAGDTATDETPQRPGRAAAVRRFVGRVARRFEEFWDAVVFVLRAGPVPAGLYVVAFAIWALFDRSMEIVALRVWGPRDADVWAAFGPLLLMLASAVATPLMIAVIATAYDIVLGLAPVAQDAAAAEQEADVSDVSEVEIEPQDP